MPNKKPTYAKVAFYTFIFAAIIYLIQALLSFVNISSGVLQAIQSIVIIVLFAVTGVAGWQFCKTKSFVYKLLYFISVLIILVSVVLPVI
ncbi:MAG: hypothetical protein ACOCWI_05180 [Bacillota bacterium]